MYTITHDDHRAHYLAMPRTGSKAVRDAFRSVVGCRTDGHHCLDDFKRMVFPGDLVMSTVRNPFDWFVSFWYLNGCPGKFDRFVPKLCDTSEWIKRNADVTECRLFWKYAPLSTHILRYEYLQDDLDTALILNGFPEMPLKQNGTPKPRPYQTYYKRLTRDYVQSRFAAEIKEYGYQF